MPTLYLVATPIGNLEDITLRALRILQEVSLVACEDTRTTRKLLSHYDIHKPLLSYNDHNKRARIPRILAALQNGDVALVTEAGLPGISDPGYDLVAAAIEAGIPVVAVPGPSAPVTALAVSGLPSGEFTFVGFLPRKKGERRRKLLELSREPRTIVCFEAPHRLRATLAEMLAVLGDRRVALCRELTKLHEEIFRGRIGEALAHFQEPRGEFTLVIEGAPPQAPEAADLTQVRAELGRLKARGLSFREAAREMAARYGVPRRRLYELWVRGG